MPNGRLLGVRWQDSSAANAQRAVGSPIEIVPGDIFGGLDVEG
jgi:hypothetical protein